jgi:hypothetical protein
VQYVIDTEYCLMYAAFFVYLQTLDPDMQYGNTWQEHPDAFDADRHAASAARIRAELTALDDALQRECEGYALLAWEVRNGGGRRRKRVSAKGLLDRMAPRFVHAGRRRNRLATNRPFGVNT